MMMNGSAQHEELQHSTKVKMLTTLQVCEYVYGDNIVSLFVFIHMVLQI